MTTLYIPSGIRIRSCRFGLQSNTQTFVSPLSGDTQRAELVGARWMATYTLTPYGENEAKLDEIKMFLLRLRGGANTFYAFDPDRRVAKGTPTGSPLVNGGSQTGTSLITDGWTASTVVLRPGDYFTVNNELKKVVSNVTSDGSGNATITFEPPLRSSPADNAPLTIRDASCIMRLVDDNQAMWDMNEHGICEITFSGVETFWT